MRNTIHKALASRWTCVVRPYVLILATLIVASGLSAAMLAARWLYTGSSSYRFLLWNLFLAWIPLVSAFAASAFCAGGRCRTISLLVCSGVWLLFFPNAPYILTDLFHLRVRDNSLFWYDLIMLLSFAWTGCFLGFVSLNAMQRLIERIVPVRFLGAAMGWALVIVMAGVSGFGIYMGRFLRWNSWDMLLRPLSVLGDIWDRIANPLAHNRTFAFSIAFSVFFLVTYLLLTSFAYLRREQPAPNSAAAPR